MSLLFDLPDGPWKKLFDGEFQGHKIEIHKNPESYLLTIVYDIKEEKPTGAILNMYKILTSTGEVEQFVETLPRELVLLSRHFEDTNIKFLLFGSGTTYVPYEKKKMANEVGLLMKHLNTATDLAMEVAKAYDLELVELEKSSEKIKDTFFTEPLLMPALSAEGKAPELKATQISKQGDIYFGLTREKQRVIEPLDFFLRTMVQGGKYPERKHVLHIVAESFLFANIPLIVFDRKGEFKHLGEPTKDRDFLKKFEIDADPIGFPIVEFKVGKQVFVELRNTHPEGFAEQFGVGEGAIYESIVELLKDDEVKNLEDAIHKVKADELITDVKGYNKYKLLRVLMLMKTRYPGVFQGTYDVNEIAKSWVKAIGRASIIELYENDKRLSLLIIHNILKSLYESRKNVGKSRGVQAAIIIPEAWKLLPQKSDSIIGTEIVNLLLDLEQCNIAYAMDTEKQIDVDLNLFKGSDAKIDIVGRTDIGIRLPDKKSYRVNARPSLSNQLKPEK